MFVWLVWAFIFLDFRLLALPHLVSARPSVRHAGLDFAPPTVGEDLSAATSKRLSIFKGFVGCLYSDVCSPGEECVNDKLFGKCVPNQESQSPETLEFHKVPVDRNFLRTLEKMMSNLWMSGFTWKDLLTQCIVRTTLASYQTRTPMDLSVCEPYVLERRGAESGRNSISTWLEKRTEEPIRVHKYHAPSSTSFGDVLQDNDDDDEGNDNPWFSETSRYPELELDFNEDEMNDADTDEADLEPADDDEPQSFDELEDVEVELPMKEDVEADMPLKEDDDEEANVEQPDLPEIPDADEDESPSANDDAEDDAIDSSIPSSQSQSRPESNVGKRTIVGRTFTLSQDANERVVDASYITFNVRKNNADGKLTEQQVANFMQKFAFRLHSGNVNTHYSFDPQEQEITFKIPPGMSTNAVVMKLRNDSQVVPGYTIGNVAIGLKKNTLPISDLFTDNSRFLLTLILCSTVLAVVTVVLIIYFIQRHRFGNKSKFWMGYDADATVSSVQPVFYGGNTPLVTGAEAYRDLCRQHAQSKAMEESVDSFLPEQGGKRHSEDSGSQRTSTSSWTEEPAQSNMDISTGHAILSYMEEHLYKKDKLEAEWRTMCSYEPDNVNISEARKDENAPKNRYIDALPYDHSRVKLQNVSPNGTDYINASFIVDHDPKVPMYIATQGPLVNTVVDFWQMVWEQNSVVVVNLSCLIEAGVPMCQKYWPEEGSQVFDKFEVHLVSEHVWCEEYLVRSFYLKNLQTNETRTITQFHYIAWPDLDVPSASRSLLEFRRKVNKSFRNRTSPIVIHCSDGCGRTGTYVLLDMILTRLARGVKEVDVAAALEHIRDQRMDMVKTKEQFEFVLLCIAEEVQSILKIMSSS